MRYFIVVGVLFSCSLCFSKDISLSCNNLLGESLLDYKKSLEGLEYLDVKLKDPVKLYEDLYYYPYPYLKIPKPVKSNTEADSLPIESIHFMQRTANYKSSASKGNYEVIQNARDLKDGRLNVEDLTRISVWKDKTGKVWTLNHRRLIAMILSGVIQEVPVLWVQPDEVLTDSHRSKYWPIKKGRRTRIIDYKKGIDILVGHK